MRRLTKADFRQAAATTAKLVAVLVVCWAMIIFSPLLRYLGYQDVSRARAVALALEMIALMALATPVLELLKRWFDHEPS